MQAQGVVLRHNCIRVKKQCKLLSHFVIEVKERAVGIGNRPFRDLSSNTSAPAQPFLR
jgi:hypothetical protein